MKRLLFFLLLSLVGIAPAQVTVTFWHSMDGPASEAIDGFAKAFNASQSDYRVEVRYAGDYREAETKLIAALRTGSAPTLFQSEIAFFPRLVSEGTLRPLDDLTATLDPDFVADFYPAPWQYGVMNGVRYGLPFNTSTPVLFYNADALRAKHLPVPGDWKTFEEDAVKLTSRRSKGFIAILDSWIFEAMVTSRGGSLVTEDGKPNFDSPEAVASLEMMRRLVDKKAAIPRNLAESQFAQLDFVRTKGMMVFASIANWPAAEKYSFAFELGVAPVPHEEGGKVPMGGAELVILKGASDEEAKGAFEFWKFLMKPENIVTWINASYYVPLRKSVVPLLEDFYAENPYRKVAFEQISRAVPRPRVPQFAVWRDYLDEALEKSLKGRMDPRAALEEAQKKALEVK